MLHAHNSAVPCFVLWRWFGVKLMKSKINTVENEVFGVCDQRLLLRQILKDALMKWLSLMDGGETRRRLKEGRGRVMLNFPLQLWQWLFKPFSLTETWLQVKSMTCRFHLFLSDGRWINRSPTRDAFHRLEAIRHCRPPARNVNARLFNFFVGKELLTMNSILCRFVLQSFPEGFPRNCRRRGQHWRKVSVSEKRVNFARFYFAFYLFFFSLFSISRIPMNIIFHHLDCGLIENCSLFIAGSHRKCG